jgi:hypothetical protein
MLSADERAHHQRVRQQARFGQCVLVPVGVPQPPRTGRHAGHGAIQVGGIASFVILLFGCLFGFLLARLFVYCDFILASQLF